MRVVANVLGGSPGVIHVRLTVTDVRNGIREITVFGKNGASLHRQPFEGCPQEAELTLPDVNTNTLPIRLLVNSCDQQGLGGEPMLSEPLLNPGTEAAVQTGTPRELCNPLFSLPPSIACTRAINAVNAARVRAEAGCATLKTLENLRNIAIALAALAWAAVTGLAVTLASLTVQSAIPFWGGIAITASAFILTALIIATAIASGLTLLATGLATAALAQRSAVNNDIAAFNEAVRQARTVCCSGQFTDPGPISCQTA